jgi:CRP-like cAMP-binding protein
MNDNLRLFFENLFGPMPQPEWTLLKGILEPIVVEKGQELHPIGKCCEHLWFMDRGALKIYEILDGRERTTHFFVENSLFIDFHSATSGNPSEFGFRAEECCHIQQMPYGRLLELFDRSHYLERLARLMAERQFMLEFELRRQLLNLDAMQRYEYLMERHPHIFRRFALKDIASFIGITPVSLSRLRKMADTQRT